MEDLSKEMAPDKPVSPKMQALLDKERREARQRIIDRGIVHFRADKEFMELLLDAADESKTAPGSLCRRIVWEQLKRLRPESEKAVLTNQGSDLNEFARRYFELAQQSRSGDMASRMPDVTLSGMAMLSMMEQVMCEQHALRDAVEQMQTYFRKSGLPQSPQSGKSQRRRAK